MSFMSSYDVSCRLMAFAALAQLYEDVETASGGLNLVSVDTRSGECTVHPAAWEGAAASEGIFDGGKARLPEAGGGALTAL